MSEKISSSSSSQAPSKGRTDAPVGQIRFDLFFWIRSEIFEYGLLPLSPHSDISFGSLLNIVRKYRYTHELNAQYLRAINTLYSSNLLPENVSLRYREWETIAGEDLLLNQTQTRAYFERFCMVRDNLASTTSTLRKPPPIDYREVNFYEFIIYLYIQLAIQPSFGYAYTRNLRRPSSSDGVYGSSAALPSPSHTHRGEGATHSARSRADRRGASRKPQQSAEKIATESSPRYARSTGIDATSSKATLSKQSAIVPANDSDNVEKPPGNLSSPTLSNPTTRSSSPGPHGIPMESKDFPFSAQNASSIPSALLSARGHQSSLTSPTHTDLASPNGTAPSVPYTPNVLPNLRSRLVSRWRVTLREQLAFMNEHLTNILRLLSSDDPSLDIRRGELEPLNFLLAVGYSNYAVHDLNLIDVLPKAATTDRYSRYDLAEWLLHRLRVNTHLYSLDPSDSNPTEASAASHHWPTKNIVRPPITLVGVHQQTVLRTDPESLPLRGLLDPLDKNASIKELDGYADPHFARILNCNSSFIYLICPVSCIKIEHCIGSTIFVGAVSSLICVENCKDTTIYTACRSVQITDCEACKFYLFTTSPPMVLGNNFGLQFAPYCAHYRSLERHVAEAGLDTSRNFWDRPVLYVVELLKDFPPNIPFGGYRHPLRSSLAKLAKQTYSLVSPDSFSPFRVPFELHGQTKQMPFHLPSDYQLALEDHTEEAMLLKKELDRLLQDKKQQAVVQKLVQEQFEKWLSDTGAAQQLEDLVKLQIE